LVTGAASGIGRAAALAFAREGAQVAVVDRDSGAGQETVRLISSMGGSSFFLAVELLAPGAIRSMVADAVSHFGRLDFAFNNAGHRGYATTAADCEEEEWDLVMGLNLKAIWLCMKYEIPEMLKVGGGAIVNTSSGMGNFAAPKMMTYVTSKHAVIGLTRSAAVDFGPLNIRVNALLPGATDTPMLAAAMQGPAPRIQGVIQRTPLRRIGLASEQAEAVVWLCSDSAAFVSGLSLVADGGLAVVR